MDIRFLLQFFTVINNAATNNLCVEGMCPCVCAPCTVISLINFQGWTFGLKEYAHFRTDTHCKNGNASLMRCPASESTDFLTFLSALSLQIVGKLVS